MKKNIAFLGKRVLDIAFMLLGIVIFAQNKYVAPTGTDAKSSGSITKPYKSITYAAVQAIPGDTIFVRAGTYTNSLFNKGGKWNSEFAVRIACTGTAAAPIVFMPYQNEKVVIRSDGNYGILIQKASYVKVIGFEVYGIGKNITEEEAWNAWGWYRSPNKTYVDGDPLLDHDDISVDYGFDPRTELQKESTLVKSKFPFSETRPPYYNTRGIASTTSNHITILNNTVHDMPSAGIRADNSDYVTIEGNHVYNNTYYTTLGVGAVTMATSDESDTDATVKMIIRNNMVHDNENKMVSWNGAKTEIKFEIDEGTGIFLTRNASDPLDPTSGYTNGYFLIANNLSYRNGASGIIVHFTNNAIVENNTVYDNGQNNTGYPGGIGFNTASNVTVRNNIVGVKPSKFAFGVVGSPVANVTMQSNIIFKKPGTSTTPITEKVDATNVSNLNLINGGWVETDPSFVDVNSDDFQLAAGSPGINSGATSTTQTYDIKGVLRDAMPDIGAYEYVDSTLSTSNLENNAADVIYPNPTYNLVSIVNKGKRDLDTNIIVYNSAGQNVTQSVRQVASQPSKVILDLSKLTPGIYFIKNNKTSYKILKK